MHVKNGSKDLQKNHKSAAELGPPSTLRLVVTRGCVSCCRIATGETVILQHNSTFSRRFNREGEGVSAE